MRNIYKDTDDLIYRLEIMSADDYECRCDDFVVDADDKDDADADADKTVYLISDFSSFSIDCYTRDKDDYFTVDAADIDSKDNLIRLQADKLASLDDGIIRLRFKLGLSDSKFSDSEFTQTYTTETQYYLRSK